MRLLVFSDIHGKKSALERLMDIDADYYFAAGDLATWGRGLEQLAPVLQKRAERMYVIPGNHESGADIARLCEQCGFQNFQGQTIQIAGYAVAGLGYSNPTPFDTPGEYTEQELAARLEKFAGFDPLILICHAPPQDTKLDPAGEGQHFGSTAVRDFIDRHPPPSFSCAHSPEAAAPADPFGRTLGWTVAIQGKVLEL